MIIGRSSCLLLAGVILITPSIGQHGHKEPTTVFTDENRLPAATYARPDPKLMQQQARDLQELSNGIPTDIENVSKGLVSRDLSERLKKIEKLAKKLRDEVER